jgi:hypothetical protein
MRAELISALTNTPSREEGSMSIMRHNTVLKKGKRTSKIGYGLGESAKLTKKYTVKGGAGIGLEIAGTDGKNKTMSLKIHSDSSPSHGAGAGLRKSLHVTLGKTDDDSLNEEIILERKMSGSEREAAQYARKQAAEYRRGVSYELVGKGRSKANQREREAAAEYSVKDYQERQRIGRTQAAQMKQARGIHRAGDFSFGNIFVKDVAGINEEAPANAMGTAGISGAQTAVDVGIAGYDLPMGMVRRKPHKTFAGKAVFTVPSKDFYNATLGRKKGKHYRSYVSGELGEEVRQYALQNKDVPIILEDETTGAMMYLRYGKR